MDKLFMKRLVFAVVLFSVMVFAGPCSQTAEAQQAEYVFRQSWGGEGNQFNGPVDVAIGRDNQILIASGTMDRVTILSPNELTFRNLVEYDTDRPFKEVSGLTTDGAGNIYISDSGNNRIYQFDSNGMPKNTWGGSGEIYQNKAIAVSSSGEVFISNFDWIFTRYSFLMRITPDGDFVQRLEIGQDFYPSSTAVEASGTIIAVNSGKIQRFDNNGLLLAEWGNGGSGDGELNNPRGIAVDNTGNVYVSDSGNHRIQKFSSDGMYLAQWGSEGSGPGQFEFPVGLGISQTGFVYVVDGNNSRIQKFGLSGTFLSQWGSAGSEPGQFSGTPEISVDSSGNVYVLDIGNHRVQKFDGNGSFITAWGSQGVGPDQFSNPRGISVDGSGKVYVLEPDQFKVFSSSGVPIKEVDLRPGMAGLFSYPADLAVAKNGKVFVSDNINDRVQVFNATGSFLYEWGSNGSEPGKLDGPFGIAVNSSNHVFVVDRWNHRVQKFSDDGTILTVWGGEGNSPGQFLDPTRIAVDEIGNVYVVDRGTDRVQKFSGSGTFLMEWGTSGDGPGLFGAPEGITIDKSGKIYVTDSENHNVQKFFSNGDYLNTWTSQSYSNIPDRIHALAVGSEGSVYFTASDNYIYSYTVNGNYKQRWGGTGSDFGQLNDPRGLLVDESGNLFVADAGNNRIQKFSSSGLPLKGWGESGNSDGLFQYPADLILDSLGRVQVLDWGNGRVQTFDQNGTYLGKWNVSWWPLRPHMAVGFQNRIYLGHKWTVYMFSNNGTLLREIDEAGNSAFGAYITDVATDLQGNLYVADVSNDFVKVFDRDGAKIQELGTGGQGPLKFQNVALLALDTEDTLVVMDKNRFQVLTRNYPSPDPDSGLIQNGTFERSPALAEWAYGGSLPVTRSTLAAEGVYSIQLGEQVTRVEQGQSEARTHTTFYVRPEWDRPMLSFKYNMYVNDIMDYSDFFVAVQDGVGLSHLATVLRDGYQPCTPGIAPAAGTNLGWRTATYDLSAYKGQHVRLVFSNRNLWPGSWGIWTYVDDVRVIDAGPAPVPSGNSLVYLPVITSAKHCDAVPNSMNMDATLMHRVSPPQ